MNVSPARITCDVGGPPRFAEPGDTAKSPYTITAFPAAVAQAWKTPL
jgi:hypothetical protein